MLIAAVSFKAMLYCANGPLTCPISLSCLALPRQGPSFSWPASFNTERTSPQRTPPTHLSVSLPSTLTMNQLNRLTALQPYQPLIAPKKHIFHPYAIVQPSCKEAQHKKSPDLTWPDLTSHYLKHLLQSLLSLRSSNSICFPSSSSSLPLVNQQFISTTHNLNWSQVGGKREKKNPLPRIPWISLLLCLSLSLSLCVCVSRMYETQAAMLRKWRDKWGWWWWWWWWWQWSSPRSL